MFQPSWKDTEKKQKQKNQNLPKDYFTNNVFHYNTLAST